ncbi:hypothetical protein D3C87_2061480 [compost metagenome]
MLAGQFLGQNGVARGDRRYDRIVIVDETFRQAIIIGLVIQPQDAPSLIQQTLE